MGKTRNFSGKVVVITGASSGFGRGAAISFAQHDASLVLAARRDELLDEVALLCRNAGASATPIVTDVSDEMEMQQLAMTAVATYGRIDVWINNAGVGALGRFEDIPLADHVQVIKTDLLGTLYGSYFAYRQFLKQGSGVLINIASELGKTSVPYYSSYTAAKHGVVGLSDSLRQEIRQSDVHNIHVCTILPTAHDTPFFDHAANYTGHRVTAPKPLHDPKEVVDAIVNAARDPDDEKIVGVDGYVKVVMANLLPGVSDKLSASQMHRTQYKDVPPAEDSPGAVRQPMSQGTEVSVGRRKDS